MIDEKQLLEHRLMAKGRADELRALSREGLACWQVGFQRDSADFLLAEKEWERRNTKELAFWQRMSAWIGVAGAVVGALIAVLGAALAKMLGL